MLQKFDYQPLPSPEQRTYETIINTMRSLNDGEFRKRVLQLLDSAPDSVKRINEDYKVSGKDKFAHTGLTLQLLDTANLDDQARFIARAGMMFHDCNPGKAISDLCVLLSEKSITNDEAIQIIKQIWWHDLLGIDVNVSGRYTSQLKYVIPDAVERQINLQVFIADVSSYGFQDQYQDVISEAKTQDSTTGLDASPNSEIIASIAERNPDYARPEESDIFIHGLYFRNESGTPKELAEKTVLNLLTANALKSTSFITQLEFMKVGRQSTAGKATDKELNVFRFQPGSFPSEIGEFGQTDTNWLSIVYLGKDIQDDCLVKPLETAENIDYVAGLVNRTDEKGNVNGCELSLDRAYFIIPAEAAESLIPLLKIEAIRQNEDPDAWILKRVIIRDGDNLEELVTKLSQNEIDILENNTRSLLKTINYSGYTYQTRLCEHFDEVTYNGITTTPFSKETEGDFLSGSIWYFDHVMDSNIRKVLGYIQTFPWLKQNADVHQFVQKMHEDKATRGRIMEMVHENDGVYFDQEMSVLYLDGQSGSIAVIDNVSGFQERESTDNGKTRVFEIKLTNGNTISISKGDFEYT